ncbi:MAG: trehalose-6-phosphate synthase [Gemmatimonadota bacterium]|nr:trehalose-6-phosphate synthase [Gemmatimonadota bacterium]
MPKPSRRRRQWPILIVANTLPVRRAPQHSRRPWVPSPGGLVTALGPVVAEAEGAWVGWTGTAGRAPRPFILDGITNVPVSVTADQVEGSYEGFCNRTLWPLYHHAVRQPEYHRHWWRAYVSLNERFADVAARTAARGARVWVQDYHLQLVPALLRARRPDLRIGFFLHIPFPPSELFLHLPWRRQVLEGLLGADVIGFQTATAATNFRRLASALTDARRAGSALQLAGRRVRVGAFPISIDTAGYEALARSADVQRQLAALHASVGRGRRVLLGVDRMDYTKGIPQRLEAYGELLARGRRYARESVLIQVAVPSRERIAEYRTLRREVDALVGRINGQFGQVGLTPITYLRRSLDRDELVAMYQLADVMVVTPLADGMNLVAKEYVASRVDGDGVLVLSQFAGAAAGFRAALSVNPHDVDGMADALQQGLEMPRAERRRRMRSLRGAVRRHSVQDWAAAFLRALDRGPSRG